MSKSSSEQKPTQAPPADSQSKKANSIQATPLQNAAIAGSATAASSSPTKDLPAIVSTGAAGTTWNNAANINALWSINQDKNSWVGIAGVSWIKLSNASDSGIAALTMLGSHGKQMGSTVYYRQEDDGMIHEFYVW